MGCPVSTKCTWVVSAVVEKTVTCVNMQADLRKTGRFLDARYDGGDGNEVKTIVQESSEDHVAKDIRWGWWAVGLSFVCCEWSSTYRSRVE